MPILRYGNLKIKVMQLFEKNVGTIIERVKFENGTEFVVGNVYFDYDGMICTEIRKVPVEEREENEVVEVFFRDGDDGMGCMFAEDGEEVYV